jgi:hypothetical protein
METITVIIIMTAPEDDDEAMEKEILQVDQVLINLYQLAC